MPAELLCDRCQFDIPLDRTSCPHCGGATICPNVRLADTAEEKAALDRRYRDALHLTSNRANVVQQFEDATSKSRAVMGATIKKLLELATGLYEVYATYYDLLDLRFLRLADAGQPDWSKRRSQAEIELLGSKKHIDQLHYAALSIDGHSLPTYGECTIWLSDKMIAHRATVFEGNSALFIHRKILDFPPGWRATWAERAKLCVAKLANRITPSTQSHDFPEILLKPGSNGLDDEFVEVHVFGEMTIRTFEKVLVPQSATKGTGKPGRTKRPRPKRGKTDPELIRDFCHQHNVDCEIL